MKPSPCPHAKTSASDTEQWALLIRILIFVLYPYSCPCPHANSHPSQTIGTTDHQELWNLQAHMKSSFNSIPRDPSHTRPPYLYLSFLLSLIDPGVE